jgi:hypothetical protein
LHSRCSGLLLLSASIPALFLDGNFSLFPCFWFTDIQFGRRWTLMVARTRGPVASRHSDTRTPTHAHAHSAALCIRMHAHACMHMLTVVAAQIAKAGKIEGVMRTRLATRVNSSIRERYAAACPAHTYHMKLNTSRRASKHRKQTKKGGASIDDTTGAV